MVVRPLPTPGASCTCVVGMKEARQAHAQAARRPADSGRRTLGALMSSFGQGFQPGSAAPVSQSTPCHAMQKKSCSAQKAQGQRSVRKSACRAALRCDCCGSTGRGDSLLRPVRGYSVQKTAAKGRKKVMRTTRWMCTGWIQPPPLSSVHSSTVFWPTSLNSMCLPLPAADRSCQSAASTWENRPALCCADHPHNGRTRHTAG